MGNQLFTPVSNALITPWVEYTPASSQGFGTLSNVNLWWRRVGDSIDIRGRFTAGTVTGSEGQIALPTGFTVSITKVPSGQICGHAVTAQTNQVNNIHIGGGVSHFQFTRELWAGGTATTAPAAPNSFMGNNEVVLLYAYGIPIA